MALHLTFQTDGKRVSYCLLDGDRKIKYGSHLLSNDLPEAGLSSFIQSELDQHAAFDVVSLAWFDSHSTLIPTIVFGETKPQAIASLCFGDTPLNQSIDYNRLAEHGIVNVYFIEDWIKRFFIMRYPRIVIQHSGSHLIRKMLMHEAFKLKVFLVLSADSCLLCMTKQNQLIHFTYIDFSNAEDLLYHTIFALKQQALLDDKGFVHLDTIDQEGQHQIDRFMELAKQISDLKNLEIEQIHNLLPKSQLLCV